MTEARDWAEVLVVVGDLVVDLDEVVEAGWTLPFQCHTSQVDDREVASFQRSQF